MAYRNDYSFVRKFNADGSMTKWYSIVSLLRDNGPMRKSAILDEVWPCRGYCVDRGYCSSLFAQLNESGFVYYSPDDLCWHFDHEPNNTRRVRSKRHNNEYNSLGLRPARKGEWDGGTYGCGMYDRNGNYVDLWC